jgi:hypothetical protein
MGAKASSFREERMSDKESTVQPLAERLSLVMGKRENHTPLQWEYTTVMF